MQAFSIAIINIQPGYESEWQQPDKMFKVASVAGKEQQHVFKGACGSVYSSIQGWHDQKPLMVPFGPEAR